MRSEPASGLLEPFSTFLRIFPILLHTREVAGSKPAASIEKSLQIAGFLSSSRHGTLRIICQKCQNQGPDEA
jgi:hypothetical protein